jgi:hypothetical protein
MVQPDEIVWTNRGEKFRVLDVIPVEQEQSDYVRFLKVESA